MNQELENKFLILDRLERIHRANSGFMDESRTNKMLALNHPYSEQYRGANNIYNELPLNRKLNQKFLAWFNEKELAFVSKPALLVSYEAVDFVADDVETDILINEKIDEWSNGGWPEESGASLNFGSITVFSEDKDLLLVLKAINPEKTREEQFVLVIEPQTLEEVMLVHQTISEHFGEWTIKEISSDVEKWLADRNGNKL